jgi:hypothetical protein
VPFGGSREHTLSYIVHQDALILNRNIITYRSKCSAGNPYFLLQKLGFRGTLTPNYLSMQMKSMKHVQDKTALFEPLCIILRRPIVPALASILESRKNKEGITRTLYYILCIRGREGVTITAQPIVKIFSHSEDLVT